MRTREDGTRGDRIMSYRDILVHLEDNMAGSSFIEAAVAFASWQNAHLAGLHVIDIPVMPGFVETNIPRQVLEDHRKRFLDRAEKTESAFNHACEKAGLSYEWRCIEGDTASTVVRAARYADLVLLAGGAGIDSADRTGVADRVVLEGGRPILVIPPVETGSAIGLRIVIAWNESKEAARAAHDALPFLRRADWVKIVSVSPRTAGEARGEIPAAEFQRHLSRHGIRAEAHAITGDSANPGKRLLAWAAGEQSNLLILGAYGHSRWTELVLGGVTAHVLRNTGIRVLMSH